MIEKFIILLFAVSFAYADKIVLVDGVQGIGKITKTTDSTVSFIKFGNSQEVTISKKKIRSYEKGDIDTALVDNLLVQMNHKEDMANADSSEYLHYRRLNAAGWTIGVIGALLSIISLGPLHEAANTPGMAGLDDGLTGGAMIGAGIICLATGTIIVIKSVPEEQYYKGRVEKHFP